MGARFAHPTGYLLFYPQITQIFADEKYSITYSSIIHETRQ